MKIEPTRYDEDSLTYEYFSYEGSECAHNEIRAASMYDAACMIEYNLARWIDGAVVMKVEACSLLDEPLFHLISYTFDDSAQPMILCLIRPIE